jgi:hypothetical protein
LSHPDGSISPFSFSSYSFIKLGGDHVQEKKRIACLLVIGWLQPQQIYFFLTSFLQTYDQANLLQRQLTSDIASRPLGSLDGTGMVVEALGQSEDAHPVRR